VLSLLLALLLPLSLTAGQPDEPSPPDSPAAIEDGEAMPAPPPPEAGSGVTLSRSDLERPSRENECPPQCELSVALPSNARMSPTISRSVFHARGGATVTITLDNQSTRTERGATVLRFEEAAFVDRNGRPMMTVSLTPGKNELTVRPYSDGACRAEKGGCKYDVINTGDPDRPVLDPHVIIWN
jgi:hypothetical protein